VVFAASIALWLHPAPVQSRPQPSSIRWFEQYNRCFERLHVPSVLRAPLPASAGGTWDSLADRNWHALTPVRFARPWTYRLYVARTRESGVYAVELAYADGRSIMQILATPHRVGSWQHSVTVPVPRTMLGFHIGSTWPEVRRKLGRGVVWHECDLYRVSYPAAFARIGLDGPPVIQYTFRRGRVIEIEEV